MEEKLQQTISQAREMITNHEYKKCEKMLRQAMGECPHEAIPHNLMGLLYEKQNDHITAMKHFRAAWSLDPTYIPAIQNLDSFGHIFSDKKYIFDESDYAFPLKIKKD
ncbi:MAG: hypothetical protein RR933_03555 [Oscillospiraceae bacterium]